MLSSTDSIPRPFKFTTTTIFGRYAQFLLPEHGDLSDCHLLQLHEILTVLRQILVISRVDTLPALRVTLSFCDYYPAQPLDKNIYTRQ